VHMTIDFCAVFIAPRKNFRIRTSPAELGLEQTCATLADESDYSISDINRLSFISVSTLELEIDFSIKCLGFMISHKKSNVLTIFLVMLPATSKSRSDFPISGVGKIFDPPIKETFLSIRINLAWL